MPLAVLLEFYLQRVHTQRRRQGFLTFTATTAPWLRIPLAVACVCMYAALCLTASATTNPKVCIMGVMLLWMYTYSTYMHCTTHTNTYPSNTGCIHFTPPPPHTHSHYNVSITKPQADAARWETLLVLLALQALVMIVYAAWYAGLVWRHNARQPLPDATSFLKHNDQPYVAPHVILRYGVLSVCVCVCVLEGRGI